MNTYTLTRIAHKIILLLVLGTPLCLAIENKWENEYVVFSKLAIDDVENDFRISKVSHQDIKLDVPVIFNPTPPEPNLEPEVMWVSILDYDEENDIFLGNLINAPHYLKSVKQYENVMFKFKNPLFKYPFAIPTNGKYGCYPDISHPFMAEFVEGVMSYRRLNFGHNPETFPDCYKHLKRAVSLIDSTVEKRDAMLAYYTLGRCYSEDYSLDSAIITYKMAKSYDPANLDILLSMISDYSVLYQKTKSNGDTARAKEISIEMRKLSNTILSNDRKDNKGKRIVELIYNCEDSEDAKPNEPCNTMRFKK